MEIDEAEDKHEMSDVFDAPIESFFWAETDKIASNFSTASAATIPAGAASSETKVKDNVVSILLVCRLLLQNNFCNLKRKTILLTAILC